MSEPGGGLGSDVGSVDGSAEASGEGVGVPEPNRSVWGMARSRRRRAKETPATTPAATTRMTRLTVMITRTRAAPAVRPTGLVTALVRVRGLVTPSLVAAPLVARSLVIRSLIASFTPCSITPCS